LIDLGPLNRARLIGLTTSSGSEAGAKSLASPEETEYTDPGDEARRGIVYSAR
jgi:hypothetical protein